MALGIYNIFSALNMKTMNYLVCYSVSNVAGQILLSRHCKHTLLQPLTNHCSLLRSSDTEFLYSLSFVLKNVL